MRALLKNWQKDTGDTTPVNFTPDGYDREKGKTLRKGRKRETMP
jgi:hypothetical protein